MADIRSTPMRMLQGRSLPPLEKDRGRIWRWVVFSGVLHLIFIWSLFLMPHIPSRRAPSYPVYSVELVGGEKLAGANLGSVVEPLPPAKKTNAKMKTEAAPRVEPVKKEKTKVKAVEAPAVMREEATLKKSKKIEVKKEPETEQALPGQLREKLIQAALERVRDRTESGQKKQKGEGITSGPGEGEGAASIGSGGRGGGIIKGVDFILYYNQMRRLIRERWTWVGKRSDLEVTVRFGIQENGEVVGLKMVQSSGDLSYDDSVSRAIRRASPLPPPPESYRKDFMDVELTFRPKDLGG